MTKPRKRAKPKTGKNVVAAPAEAGRSALEIAVGSTRAYEVSPKRGQAIDLELVRDWLRVYQDERDGVEKAARLAPADVKAWLLDYVFAIDFFIERMPFIERSMKVAAKFERRPSWRAAAQVSTEVDAISTVLRQMRIDAQYVEREVRILMRAARRDESPLEALKGCWTVFNDRALMLFQIRVQEIVAVTRARIVDGQAVNIALDAIALSEFDYWETLTRFVAINGTRGLKRGNSVFEKTRVRALRLAGANTERRSRALRRRFFAAFRDAPPRDLLFKQFVAAEFEISITKYAKTRRR